MSLSSDASSHISVRPYEERDAAATLEVFTSAVTVTAATDYTPEQIEAWARPGQRDLASWHATMQSRESIVATSDDVVVGFSDVSADGYIDMLFVAPEAQRLGVARRLLAEIEDRARSSMTPVLSAHVSLTAKPFFEAHGFRVVAERHPSILGVHLTNFLMEKALTGR